MTELCRHCARQNICGNDITNHYCTGYIQYVETRWDADDIKTPPFTEGQKRLIEMTEKLAEKHKKIKSDKSMCDNICDIDDI